MKGEQTSSALLAEFGDAGKTARGLFLAASKGIPDASQLAVRAIREALGDPPYDTAHIKNTFSDLVSDIQLAAYGLYLAAEREACGPELARYVEGQMEGSDARDALDALSQSFFVLDRFCLSLTQSRRARAGATFESVVTVLFEAVGYPYTSQPLLSGSRPDFVLPSVDHYGAFATDCIIFTCKRTLRERWRQVITEGLTGQAFFLATIDVGLSGAELGRMKDRNVIVVVPRDIKTKHYSAALNVINFESFFDHHLDPAMNRWISNGVI